MCVVVRKKEGGREGRGESEIATENQCNNRPAYTLTYIYLEDR